MRSVVAQVSRFMVSEDGPTAVEYAVMLALILVVSPLLTGLVRKVKARVQRRRGPSVIQPYRDLRRLLGKEAVLAENA